MGSMTALSRFSLACEFLAVLAEQRSMHLEVSLN